MSFNNKNPLIIESHPSTYDGYPFVTLIQYGKLQHLVVVDNMDGNTLRAYVLDYCATDGVDEEVFVELVNEWYEKHRLSGPLSIFLNKSRLFGFSKIYRTYSIDSIKRVIGPVFSYPLTKVAQIRRRKRRVIPSSVEID